MTSQLDISLGQCSDKGGKSRNEDFHGACLPGQALRESKGLAIVVADGMGSCEYAQEASEYCAKGFLDDYFSTPETWSVKSSGAKVLTAINSWLLSNGGRNHKNGMVTTFSGLVLKSTTAHIFHVGDSRIYRFRNNDLEQLTTDHRIRVSNNRNYLSRAMGIDQFLDIDYRQLGIEPGDIFLLTTDGVHDYLSDAQLKAHLSVDQSPDTIAADIIQHAIDSQTHDNATCQVVRVESLPAQDANEVYNELTRLPFPPHLGPGMTMDGYEILEEIHASTTSQLYKVRDSENGELYIMKTPSVNFSDDPAYIERFYMEEWAGKRIKSDAVLKIIEQTRPRNFLYFIMEYLEGITLKEWMRQNPAPHIEHVTAITGKIIKGLRVFHRLEMLHRDLKPDNVMITEHGVVKIIDFGSVKIAGVQETSSPVERDEILGTKNYTAPEYLLGMAGNTRSDLYSLGVLVYEMLTGHLPYGERMSREMNWRKLNKIRYTPAIEYNPMLPLWLDGALNKAVRLDHKQRYETFSEFYYDLTHPNPAFMRDTIPLAQRNPVLLWQLLVLALFLINLLLVYFLTE